MKKLSTSRFTLKLVTAVCTSLLVMQACTLTALADSKGTVNVNDAKVRSDASTDASTVTKVNSGTEVTVTDEKSDSSGNVWYHVTLSDGTVGYIRSDLMTVTASEPAGESTDDAGAAETPAADAMGGGNVVNGIDVSAISVPEGVDVQDYQSATTGVDSGKVRSDASTNDEIVAILPRDTDLVVAGSKLGSDSKTWYYVAFSDGGVQKTGYIRSDLINMGDVIVISAPVSEEPVVDEQVAEEPAEPEINNDYELVYTDDGTGTNVWYLYNHIDNTREKLQELLDYADSQANKSAEYSQKIQKLKILAIVLGVLLAIAVIVIIVMVIRLVNAGYEYEDEDDEEEEEEVYVRGRDRSRRRRYEEDDEDEKEEEEEVRKPQRTQRTSRESAAARDREPSQRETRERPRTETREPAVKEAAPKAKSKPKNFMLDDDDFEFEFLDVDDK